MVLNGPVPRFGSYQLNVYGGVPPVATISILPTPFSQVPVTNNSYPNVFPFPKPLIVGVIVGVGVCVEVIVGVGVGVKPIVGVGVGVGVFVGVGVGVGVCVEVGVGVTTHGAYISQVAQSPQPWMYDELVP